MTRGHRLDRFALSAIERGRRRVDVDELVILADLLDVEPAALLAPVTVRVVLVAG
ncbi:helix-turn-helix domain-containing protein [Nonomuraea sp. M3C6]|uniref:Helix-turn-helix domain-containing protein n=1 Tax=Nonomuraea marmarensis TaxID=3351344 RepID=A0ABW7AYF7_9ACTN